MREKNMKDLSQGSSKFTTSKISSSSSSQRDAIPKLIQSYVLLNVLGKLNPKNQTKTTLI